MAWKGSSVLSKPMFAVITFMLVIFALIFIYAKISTMNVNPCWEEVVTGLEPLKIGTSASPVLRFDSKCLGKFVITTSRGKCNDVCREIDDTDQQRACVKSCSAGKEGDPITFIIAVPDDRWFGGRVAEAVSNRDFFWVFSGKAEVFSFACQAGSVDAGIAECVKDGVSWLCKPGDEKNNYALAIDETQKVCDIKIKA